MNPPKPIRVLHVLHRMDYGGIESWLMGILRLLDPAEVHFDFLVHGLPGAHEPEILRLGGGIIRGDNPHRPMQFSQRLRAVLMEHDPYQAVHSHLHLYSGLVLRTAATCGVHVRIAHSHSNTPSERGLGRRFYAWTMRRWIRRYATMGLAVSRSAMTNLYGQRPDPRWQVLSCGINLSAFRKEMDRIAIRRSLGIDVNARVIGHVGRLAAVKNHDFILRLAAIMPDTWFLLVGDGELRKKLESQAAALEITNRIVFTGARNDIESLLCVMDAFVFPSHFEGLPLAVVEAQAAGLPIVMANSISAEAVIIPSACTVLALSTPIEIWAAALRKSRRLTDIDTLALVAKSPFNQQACLIRLHALYQGRM